MRASWAERVVYEVPVERLPGYRGQKVIVRAPTAAAVVSACRRESALELVYAQISSLTGDVGALADWGYGLPVELVMTDPRREFPSLYRHARLLEKHPLRVVVPVRPGFSRAVKVALSLQIAVKLDVGQPSAAEIRELAGVLDFYLRDRSCGQPIGYFHGTLRALYDEGDAVTLWDIQEEDPARVRRVGDDGVERLMRRDGGVTPDGDLSTFVARLRRSLVDEPGGCAACECWTPCGGYFKWPQRDYDCTGVKALFRTLAAAATELREDVAAVQAPGPRTA